MEKERLRSIVHDLTTLPKVLAILGDPDNANMTGFCQTTTTDDGRTCTTYYTTLTYEKLSPMADILVVVYPDDRVQFSIVAKAVEADRR